MSSGTNFEITRLRQDRQSSREGCSVFLRFSVTGPPGTHRVIAKISAFSGSRPKLGYDRKLSLVLGATGHFDIVLDFDRNPLDSCTLSMAVSGRRLGTFLVQPPGTSAPALGPALQPAAA